MDDAESSRPRVLEEATAEDWLGSNRDPDVLLSVPDLGVDKITLNVEDLRADVDLHARVLDIVELHVGAHVTLGKVELDIENVRARAMLKVKLDKVAEIIDRVMQTIDTNPELLTTLLAPIGRGIEEIGQGVGDGVREIGEGSTSVDGARQIETARDVEYREGATMPEARTRRVGVVEEADYSAVPEDTVTAGSSGEIETVLIDGSWWNRVTGTEEATGPYESQEAAIKEGKDQATSAHVAHVIRDAHDATDEE